MTNHPELDTETSDEGIGAGGAGMFWDYAEPNQSSGEACGARVVDNVINNVAAYADAGLGFHAMTACAASVSKKALPEISSSVDLSESLAALDMAGQNFEISSATIEREQNAENGDAIFVTKISGWMKDVAREMKKDFTLQVRHKTGTFDATDYSGSLKFIVEDFENGNDLAISIRYAWSSAKLKYRYRQAQIASATDNNFSTDHELSTASATGTSQWTEVISNNDKNGLGKIAIVTWKSDLNIFNAETKADGTGVAYFGHSKGESADFDSAGISLITGFKCLPITPPPPGIEPFSNYVQRQTFKLASDGSWGLDQSNIAYAPISTCNWTASEDASGSATFVAQNDGHTKTLAFPLENSLYSKADYSSSWVAPELP